MKLIILCPSTINCRIIGIINNIVIKTIKDEVTLRHWQRYCAKYDRLTISCAVHVDAFNNKTPLWFFLGVCSFFLGLFLSEMKLFNRTCHGCRFYFDVPQFTITKSLAFALFVSVPAREFKTGAKLQLVIDFLSVIHLMCVKGQTSLWLMTLIHF